MSLVKRALAKANKTVAISNKPEAKAEPLQTNVPSQTDYEFYLAALSADLAQLKTFNELAEKADYKAVALEKNDYLQFIRDYKSMGANYPNKVLAWVFIWLVDLKRWANVLELLPLLIEQKQPLPKQFNTPNWPTFLIDQLYDEVNWHLQNECKPDDYANCACIIYRVIDAVKHQDWAGSELAGGKLYAIACKLEATQHNYGNAIRYGEKAQEINEAAGVKTLVTQLQKKLS